MIGMIQRVTRAKVEVDGQIVGRIDHGLLLLLGVEKHDTLLHAKRLANKVLNYRVFEDSQGKMNLNLQQVQGSLLIISQFTLVADTTKGNRPSFSSAASPQDSETLYHFFIEYCRKSGCVCETGQFGANMQVSLVNDGPVTFQLSV